MAEKNTELANASSEAPPSEDTFDYDAYARVSRAAQLLEIKLIDSQYSIKPEVFAAIEDLDSMNHGFVGESGPLNFDPEEGIAMGNYRWTAEIKHGRKKVLKLVVNYLIVYSDLYDFDEAHVRFYFNKVGRFASYPYFRAIFSHHTSESGILLPPLPTLSERVN